jgi:hypothetical protein
MEAKTQNQIQFQIFRVRLENVNEKTELMDIVFDISRIAKTLQYVTRILRRELREYKKTGFVNLAILYNNLRRIENVEKEIPETREKFENLCFRLEARWRENLG